MLLWFALMTIPQFGSNYVYTVHGQSSICYTTLARAEYFCLRMLGQCCGRNKHAATALNIVQNPTADGC
jgi:hypothetical protein